MMNFGNKLKVMRALRGLSQERLAKLVDTRRVNIIQIEAGELIPGPDLESRIREALDWPADADEAFAILAGEGEPALTEVAS